MQNSLCAVTLREIVAVAARIVSHRALDLAIAEAETVRGVVAICVEGGRRIHSIHGPYATVVEKGEVHIQAVPPREVEERNDIVISGATDSHRSLSGTSLREYRRPPGKRGEGTVAAVLRAGRALKVPV